jgi:prophage maintenance system killer protein
MMGSMTVLTASYLGFCAGATLVALILGGALAMGHWRHRRQQRDVEAKQDDDTAILDITTPMAQTDSLLLIVTEYAHGLQMLDDYDHERMSITGTTPSQGKPIDYDDAINQIGQWREQRHLGPLFGNEKDDSFKGSLNGIYASFDGKGLYPSVEEKAAHLLYFIVKNHSFTDGNKRIGAAMFTWFLHRNDCLYQNNGQKRIANNALVAITLLVAQSDPAQREVMLALIANLINQSNEAGNH